MTTPFGDTSVQPTAITVVATPSAVTTTGTAMPTTPTIVTATTAKTTKVTEKAVTAPNAQTTAPPPKEDDIIYVLSLGNSYSMDAHAYLSRLAEHEGKSIYTVNLYYSGCSLKQHYTFWKNQEAPYKYEVNGKIDWNSAVSLMDILPTQEWDVITLQESSYAACLDGAWDRQILAEFLALFRAACPQARIMLHQPWAYGDHFENHDGNTGGSMAAMWAKCEPKCRAAAEDTGLSIIPCGHAMFRAQQLLNTGKYSISSIQRDESHAEASWGRYMLALVWYAAITGEKPSNTFDEFTGWFIEDKVLRDMVYTCAMNAIKTYYPL